MIGVRILALASALWLASACVHLQSSDAPLVGRKQFAWQGAFDQVRLSPDGLWIAYTQRGAQVGHLMISEVRCAPCAETRHVDLGDQRLLTFYWTNDSKRLLISHVPAKGGPPEISTMDIQTPSRLHRLTSGMMPKFVTSSPVLGHTNPQIVYSTREGRTYKVNLDDGRLEELPNQAGRTLVTRAADGEYIGYRYSKTGDQEWFVTNGSELTPLTRFKLQDVLLQSQFVSTSGGVAYFLDSSDTDTVALIEVDLRNGKKTVVVRDRADVRNVLLARNGAVLGYATEYLTPLWTPQQPTVGNVLSKLHVQGRGFPEVLDVSDDLNTWVVRFTGPGSAPGHFIFHAATQDLIPLERGLANFSGAWSPTMPFEVLARDGLPLTAYFTPPNGKTCEAGERCPLVLLIHGGPRSRDRWGGVTYHQLMANRGYAVLSVNYRGSRGFGKRFEALGEGEWGGAMLDDVFAALDWVLVNRSIDKERIAAMGASHGGYLALSSVKSRPNTFACAVGLSATADLVTFVDEVVKAVPQMSLDLFASVGNPGVVAERELMRERSPATYPERFARVPVLLMHGSRDTMAPIKDVRHFSKSVNDSGGTALLVELKEEGHVFRKGEAEDLVTYTVERFLSYCLRGRVEPLKQGQVPISISGAGPAGWNISDVRKVSQ